MQHKPVLLREAIESLNLFEGAIAVDGTLGGGGHAKEIANQIGETGKLVALDRDADAIARCKELFSNNANVLLYNGNYLELDGVLDSLAIKEVNAVLLDIGVSMFQLATPERGFSFQYDAPLDMRMDLSQQTTASDLVNKLSQAELEELLREYGEVRWAKRFSAAIVAERARRKIETTLDLARIIQESLPAGLRFAKGKRPVWFRHHPATLTFQALRIAVNEELSILSEALPRIWSRIASKGRFSIISFHSLEDRIVKRQFRKWHDEGEGTLVFKKPVVPDRKEVEDNPRARSAKLRTIEKIK